MESWRSDLNFERQSADQAAQGNDSTARPFFNGKTIPNGVVEAVSANPERGIAKPNRASVRLLVGLGVEGDVHLGATIRHVYRMKKDPEQPNLRQVHLIHGELHDDLRAQGFDVEPGEMGENITTRGIDLLMLPAGTRLHLGASAVVEVTGLRSPCETLDGIQPGLMKAVGFLEVEGKRLPRTGVMGIVLAEGVVERNDTIRVELPPEPHQILMPV
jgi:MOSC domain-containing protein YiiM